MSGYNDQPVSAPQALAETIICWDEQWLLDTLRHVLSETRRWRSLELLERAVNKACADETYATAMSTTVLCGSTLEWRDLLSAFGDYIAPPRSEMPYYPHQEAVDGIDSAMFAIRHGQRKPGEIQAYIDFIKVLRS